MKEIKNIVDKRYEVRDNMCQVRGYYDSNTKDIKATSIIGIILFSFFYSIISIGAASLSGIALVSMDRYWITDYKLFWIITGMVVCLKILLNLLVEQLKISLHYTRRILAVILYVSAILSVMLAFYIENEVYNEYGWLEPILLGIFVGNITCVLIRARTME